MPRANEAGKTKIRNYFLSRVGEVVEARTLQEVSGISEWARRVRELRQDEGLDILSHNECPDLKPGQYVLASLQRRARRTSVVDKKRRALVLARDGHTCQSCGAVAGEPHPYEPARRTVLHVGHRVHQSLGGTRDLSNLWATCSLCNEGLSNLEIERPSETDLLTMLRRAAPDAQQAAYRWLHTRWSSLHPCHPEVND